MATPLYKSMKTSGISFYTFASSAEDITIAYQNQDYKMNFSKFVLLNLPQQSTSKLNFKDTFYTADPNTPSKFSDQLIESLRNYVANQEVNIRQAKINSNTDFYNVGELDTVAEKVFWKWLHKLGVLDFEPAIHKIDYDKNLSDFDNPNASTTSNSDYFRKYLWKERDINYYQITNIQPINSTQSTITVSDYCKYRTNDTIFLSGYTNGVITSGTTNPYTITNIDISSTGTTLTIDGVATTSYTPSNNNPLYCYLNYTKVVNYIGEINANTKVQTSKTNYSQITAFIPHDCGQTPTVLWGADFDTNYRPNMEYPMYDPDIQPEILGAENLNSPIRTNPANYPGSFYGQFDTADKTYTTSNGDQLRYNGDYFGINLTNNVGTDAADYVEKLNDFNSTKLDGLTLDFDTTHYLKMNLPDYVSKNFDEFNSMSFGQTAPSDFEFNIILWFYEIDDGQGNITNNLYGISFLNNPANDDDDTDVNNTLITPYKKLVSNGVQDGLSYIFDLKLNFEVDNDLITPDFDPTAIHNSFGFDLYNNIMTTLGQIQENFINIADEFVRINSVLNDMKSLIYSQTSIDYLKNRMSNIESLLKLYQTNQLVNSDTAEIEVDYTTIYPTIKVNVVELEYKDIETVTTNDIYTYNVSNSASTTTDSYIITIPNYNKKMLYIVNNDINGVDYNLSLVLNNDLKYKQEFDIIIEPKLALYSKKLTITMNYNDGVNGAVETVLIDNLDMPVDLNSYDITTSAYTYNRAYYCTKNVSQFIDSTAPTGTTFSSTALYCNGSNLFNLNEYVFIHNLFYYSGSTVVDYSGYYKITEAKQPYITIDLNTYGLTLAGSPIVEFFKGLSIKILRVTDVDSTTGVDTSSISNRYLITKNYL
jgi:hypothetical protein